MTTRFEPYSFICIEGLLTFVHKKGNPEVLRFVHMYKSDDIRGYGLAVLLTSKEAKNKYPVEYEKLFIAVLKSNFCTQKYNTGSKLYSLYD